MSMLLLLLFVAKRTFYNLAIFHYSVFNIFDVHDKLTIVKDAKLNFIAANYKKQISCNFKTISVRDS